MEAQLRLRQALPLDPLTPRQVNHSKLLCWYLTIFFSQTYTRKG